MDKPKRWVKNAIKNLTQWLGLSIFDPRLGSNNPAFFRVWMSVGNSFNQFIYWLTAWLTNHSACERYYRVCL